MTDASIKRLLKAVKERMQSENIIGHGVGSMDAVRVYKKWITEEINHNGDQWKDWRCADTIMRVYDKLSNPSYINGVSTSTDSIIMCECFKRDLMVGIFYEWQQKTIAIDQLHNAQNIIADLVSKKQ
tara:strand:+ start:53 stop:433 length:381 start_codon:yes stop_codon:yes gene_type:complete